MNVVKYYNENNSKEFNVEKQTAIIKEHTNKELLQQYGMQLERIEESIYCAICTKENTLKMIILIEKEIIKRGLDFYVNNGTQITIFYANYGSKNRNLGDLLDWLSDTVGIVQLNELYQNCVSDDCGNLFDFTNQDEILLAKNGKVVMEYSGETLKDYKETHGEVYKWFWN